MAAIMTATLGSPADDGRPCRAAVLFSVGGRILTASNSSIGWTNWMSGFSGGDHRLRH